jgi:hypothetical protein
MLQGTDAVSDIEAQMPGLTRTGPTHTFYTGHVPESAREFATPAKRDLHRAIQVDWAMHLFAI